MSSCHAEMRRSVMYTIHICVQESGIIDSSQCECAAGMGPTAHCKHIRATLHALVEFSAGKDLHLEVTCTDTLQTFHHPKKRHFGSPIKATGLKLGKFDDTSLIFDPTPADYYESPSKLNSRIKNETINYAALTKLSVPLLQCIPPAITFAINNDHDYLHLSPANDFLLSSGIAAFGISTFEVHNIEANTRQQANCPQWHTERCKRLHSCNFGRIAKAAHRTDFNKLASTLMTPRQEVFSSALLHGKKFESVARRNYELAKGVSVTKSGIVVDFSRPYLGCSPDGLVGLDRVLEVVSIHRKR